VTPAATLLAAVGVLTLPEDNDSTKFLRLRFSILEPFSYTVSEIDLKVNAGSGTAMRVEASNFIFLPSTTGDLHEPI